MTNIKQRIEEIEKTVDKKFTDLFWANTQGRNDIRNEQIKKINHTAILNLLTELAEEMEGLKNTKDHYCAFNDGNSHCDCFNAGITAAQEKVRKI